MRRADFFSSKVVPLTVVVSSAGEELGGKAAKRDERCLVGEVEGDDLELSGVIPKAGTEMPEEERRDIEDRLR